MFKNVTSLGQVLKLSFIYDKNGSIESLTNLLVKVEAVNSKHQGTINWWACDCGRSLEVLEPDIDENFYLFIYLFLNM